MATYIPNATQTTEPVESRTVESAALEFRTLKASVNARIEDVQDNLANLQTQNNSQDVRIQAIEAALLAIGEGGLPGTVYVQRLSGTGTQTAFTLNVSVPTSALIDIFINGVYQNKDTFTIVDDVLTFSEAPPAGTNNVEVVVSITIANVETDASLVSYGGTTVAAQLDAIPANFVQVTGNQTIGGVKTFSSPPVVPTDSFSFAQLQNIPTGTILGRVNAGTGDMKALTGAQATALLSSASETERGLVELADTAEAQALASDTLALTPARLADAFKGANQSLNTNGYQKLPGGLIIQWGRRTVGDHGRDYYGNIYFPIAFPNNVFQVNATLYSYGGVMFDASAAVTAQRLTGFDFTIQEWSSGTQNIEVVYIAIGG